MKATPELSLVICTLDEAEAIGGVLDELIGDLAALAFELIVVDDSSSEATAEVVRGRMADDPRIRLIHREGPRGLASAAIAGWDAARGRVLGVMDGDGQHDPSRLPLLLHLIEEGQADVALASRYATADARGLSGYRDLLSRSGTALTGLLLGAQVTDPLSGLFLMRRDWYVAVRPRLSGVGFKILIDVLASGRRPPRTSEVATALRPRAGGASKLDARVVADLFALLIEKRTGGVAPARFVLFTGVGASGVAVHLLTLQLVRSLTTEPFWAAQAVAIFAAMTTNFLLNNALTFRDRRVRGLGLLRALLAFYVACSIGAAANEALAAGLQQAGVAWLVAGGAGAVIGALLNYALSRRLAWGFTSSLTD